MAVNANLNNLRNELEEERIQIADLQDRIRRFVLRREKHFRSSAETHGELAPAAPFRIKIK